MMTTHDQNLKTTEAIEAEREKGEIDIELELSLPFCPPKPKSHALVFGDPAKVQTFFLLGEKQFGRVVTVDSHEMVLDGDDFILGRRLLKLQLTMEDFFSDYFEEARYNLVYVRSFADIPKEMIPDLLTKIEKSLVNEGVFYANWPGELDVVSQTYYSGRELRELYKSTNLQIKEKDDFNPKAEHPIVEQIHIVARKMV